MKLASVVYQQEQFVARVEQQSVYLYRGSQNLKSVLDVIDSGASGLQAIADIPRAHALSIKDVEFLAPIPRPRSNVMCLGLNYLKHVQENTKIMGREVDVPEFPIVFTKAPSAVNAPYGDIELDENITHKLDWEVELGVIIGKGGKGIKAQDAMQHVFAYTIINDVTARDLQRQHKQFFIGKSLDGACPMGPIAVTPDEITNPHDLRITSRVNGQTQQDANTSQMIFKISNIIEILSRSRTLEAGDVIATGTPSGVGVAQDPARFLAVGDILESEIEGIGFLRNRIVGV